MNQINIRCDLPSAIPSLRTCNSSKGNLRWSVTIINLPSLWLLRIWTRTKSLLQLVLLSTQLLTSKALGRTSLSVWGLDNLKGYLVQQQTSVSSLHITPCTWHTTWKGVHWKALEALTLVKGIAFKLYLHWQFIKIVPWQLKPTPWQCISDILFHQTPVVTTSETSETGDLYIYLLSQKHLSTCF